MQESYNNLTGSEWAQLGTSTLGLGLGFAGKQEETKSAQATADALRSKGYSDVEVAKLMLEGKKLDLQTALASGGKASSGGNTMLYIGLGIGGVVILGLVIFAVTRKKA